MSKTFEDSKQQVAEKYGYKDWNELYKHTVGREYADYSLELIERYAQYQREEGRKEGEMEGWNEALQQVLLSSRTRREILDLRKEEK